MGAITSKTDTPMKIMLEGLNGSGKTSLVYRMEHGKMFGAPPDSNTNGVIQYVIEFQGEMVEVWDPGYRGDDSDWDWAAGSRCSFSNRELFRSSYRRSDGLVYILDSAADTWKMDEGIRELDKEILQYEQVFDNVVMVLANKQDLEGALGPEEIEARIEKTCNKYFGTTFFVMPCSVATGEGIMEAFARFTELVRLKNIDKKLKKKKRTVPVGLIPHAWELPDEEPENNQTETKTEEVKGDEDQRESCCKMNKTKKAWQKLKDPFKMVRSILTY